MALARSSNRPYCGCVEPGVVLRLADHHLGLEAVLADRAADRAGEHAGLQRGHPDLAVELRAPWRLVCLDQQPQKAATELIPGGRLSRLLQCGR